MTGKRKLMIVVLACMMAIMLQTVVGGAITATLTSASASDYDESEGRATAVTWTAKCTSSSSTELYGDVSSRLEGTNSWTIEDSDYVLSGRSISRRVNPGSPLYWKVYAERSMGIATGTVSANATFS